MRNRIKAKKTTTSLALRHVDGQHELGLDGLEDGRIARRVTHAGTASRWASSDRRTSEKASSAILYPAEL